MLDALAVIADKDKQRMRKPRLLASLGHKLADAPIGIFYDLVFNLLTFGVKIGRNDVRRMIRHGQNRSEERFSAACAPVYNGQRIREKVII